MIIAATADIHSPRYYVEFVRALDFMQTKPDLFLIAGDMIDRGALQEYSKVSNALFGKVNCPIIACFGNGENIPDITEEIKEKNRNIKFLKDESTILRIGGMSVGIVGTTGSLDEPTNWQKQNTPNIGKVYQERISFVDRHLQRMMVDFKIVLMHYAPTYKILEGENPRFYAGLGSQAYENVINSRKPSLVVHAHSHRGKKQVWIDTVPVVNVCFPLNGEIVIIDTEKLKPGLAKFV